MSNPILRLSCQSEATWASFHQRVSSIPYDYFKLFPEPVFNFLKHKAYSMGSSLGYLVPSLLTSTAYLLANKDASLMISNHLQPINLFMMFVGYPGTGKSPAVESVLKGLKNMDCINAETLISTTTSSGLVKTLSKQGRALLASPELFDVLNKLLKNDEDNASGNVQLLCKLWSGEGSSYHFATESTREINSNTTFSILGATQIQNAATVLYRMDKGHGLIDRFLFTVPFALKPTPQEEEQSIEYLNNQTFKDFDRLFTEIEQMHHNITRTYTLSNAAMDIYKALKTQHVHEVNEAIKNGDIPPKSKSYDLVARLAIPIHVITACVTSLLQQNDQMTCSEEINEDIYRKSMAYVDYLHSQKAMFTEFIHSILNNAKESTKPQPTASEIQSAILKFSGPLVTFQAISKSLRTKAYVSISGGVTSGILVKNTTILEALLTILQ
ncbi:uncharacterized protein LOC116308118 [Actinia tenebrosa]|uniref:Uncharacterized protein LOC116308118 n=1 Tax=Actinia tenebrosa TaxID=6105 RepID=A0A6P8JCQ0_ACTTE|nr:uncharacterized protein LOC116308118 [Actinia tenebrosa]